MCIPIWITISHILSPNDVAVATIARIKFAPNSTWKVARFSEPHCSMDVYVSG